MYGSVTQDNYLSIITKFNKPSTVCSSGIRTRTCNICNASFLQISRFDRFCNHCRTDEIYKFAEWTN